MGDDFSDDYDHKDHSCFDPSQKKKVSQGFQKKKANRYWGMILRISVPVGGEGWPLSQVKPRPGGKGRPRHQSSAPAAPLNPWLGPLGKSPTGPEDLGGIDQGLS